jgi:hypothetical protein
MPKEQGFQKCGPTHRPMRPTFIESPAPRELRCVKLDPQIRVASTARIDAKAMCFS